MKKFLCLLLIVAMLFSITNSVFASNQSGNTETSIPSVDEILEHYQEELMQLKQENTHRSYAVKASEQSQLKQQTIEKLRTHGYSAYDVNPDSYAAVEEELRTDFDAINLDPSGSYIIVVSGENLDPQLQSRETAGSSFYYMGYTMRYLTITAADNSSLTQMTEVDLLKSSSQSTIMNCLNTLISMAISYASSTLGTVASFCGLSIDDFMPNKNVILRFNAGSSWTQVYTQVLNPTGDSWWFGSCVTRVYGQTWLYYAYYKNSTNAYNVGTTSYKTATLYSPHYSDFTWRKEQAIVGSQIGYVYDATGNVQYKYGNNVIITHRE